MLETGREGREPGVVLPLGPFERRGEPSPELLLVAHQEDPAVAGAVELARDHRRMRRTREPGRREPLVEIPGRVVAEVVAGDVEEAHVIVAARPARARLQHPGHERERGGEPGHVVDDRDPVALRGPFRGAGELEVARLRLHEEVEPRPGRPVPIPPVGREVDADDGRVAIPEVAPGEAEGLGLIASKVPEHRLAARGQISKYLLPRRRLEIELQAPLVAVEALVEVAVAGPEEERPDPPPELAPLRRVLDLDDVGAEVGEIGRAERTRAVLLHGEDPEPGEGKQRPRPRRPVRPGCGR